MLVEVKDIRPQARQSNFELLRIIAMIMIIASHLAQHSLTGNWQILRWPFSLNMVWANLLGTHGQLGVCVFIFISSWFLCRAQGIHIKKLLLINLECLFYSASIFLLLKLSGLELLGVRELLKVLFVPWLEGYWFVLAYFCFYLCVPALQLYSRTVSLDSQGKLLVVLTALIPVYQGFLDKFMFGNVGFFIYIYLLCSYLKGSSENFLERHCVPVFLLCFFFVTGGSLAIRLIGHGVALSEVIASQLHARMNLLVMIEAAALFYIFKRYVNLGFVWLINEIAKTALGIYIIHECWLFNLYPGGLHEGGILFEYLLGCGESFLHSRLFPLYYLAVVLGLFVVCSFVEYMRILLFDKGLFARDKKLETICKKFDLWYRLEAV